MRNLQLINRAFLCVVVCSLFVMYLTAFVSFAEYGQWPSYGNPESWSSHPFNVLPWSAVFSVLPIIVLLIFPLAAAVALGGMIGGLFVAKKRTLRGYVEPVLLLVAIALVYIDPFGVTNWFVD